MIEFKFYRGAVSHLMYFTLCWQQQDVHVIQANSIRSELSDHQIEPHISPSIFTSIINCFQYFGFTEISTKGTYYTTFPTVHNINIKPTWDAILHNLHTYMSNKSFFKKHWCINLLTLHFFHSPVYITENTLCAVFTLLLSV